LGFGIALVYDDDAQAKRIQSDFITTMRQLVHAWHVDNGTWFLELPSYVAESLERVSGEELEYLAQAYATKTRCHFMVWGRAKLRHDLEDIHVLDLRGLVRHKEIKKTSQAQLSSEFNSVFPRRVRVAMANDFVGFEVSAQSLDLVARYITSLAAALSGDLSHAIRLLEQLSNALEKRPAPDEIATRLKSRVPKQLTRMRDARLDHLMHSYIRSRDPEMLCEVAHLTSVYTGRDAKRYYVSIARAICFFMLDRNVAAAREELKRHAAIPDPSCQISLAFLDAYEGDLQGAYRRYMSLNVDSLSSELVVEVEEFIHIVLEQEPHQKQLLFLTGMINERYKGDYASARRDLREFVRWAENHSEFARQVKAAEKWLKEIRYKR